jgi:hypothetical protein
MKLTIKTAHGYLSFQPDGRLEYRQIAGPWENVDVAGFELPVPVAPVPNVPPPSVASGCDQFATPGDNSRLVQCVCDQVHPQGSVPKALEVAGRVAWALRAFGAGLSAKPAGENIADYHGTSVSVSRVMFRDGRLIKILTDVPTTNGPTWSDNGTLALDKWVAPVQP